MENRCQKLARSMPEGFEAALVTTAPNRFYFLDFDADDAGSLLIFPDESVFLIDSRYIEVAEKTVKSAKVVEEHDRLAQIAQLLHRHGVHRLYLEEEITVAEAARFGARGVRVLSVTPGNFDTPMGKLEKDGAGAYLKFNAIPRLGKPDEIAALFAAVSDPEMGYLTGTDILCDGGCVAGKIK